jgi:D-threo-aldose 1-dehydrogenase
LAEPKTAGDSHTVPADLWNTLSTDRARKEAAAVEAVQRAISLGVNYFDTAPMYGAGEAERNLGLGLQSLAPEARSRVYVSTKVGWHPERQHQYDADAVRWSLERSLQAFHSEHVDIVHIHYPLTDAHMDQILGPGGAVEALEQLKAQGVVGAISLGSRPHRFIRRAIESGCFDLVMTVYDYNLIRASAAPMITLAAEHGLGLINASPYNAGLLAGVNPGLAAARRPPDLPGDLERAQALWRWSRARGVDLGALAMQFSLRYERVTVTLTGPRDAGEVEDSLRHATTPLPLTIWEELDAFLATLGLWVPGGEAGVLA